MARTGPADDAERDRDPRIVRVLPAGTMQGVAIEAHLDAAAATGFQAISLRPRHVRAWLDERPGRSLDGLGRRLRESALGLAELDPVTGWSDPGSWSSTALPASILDDLDMAASLGAGAVTALVAPGEPWRAGPGTEGLGRMCTAAAERDVLVQVEPFGWSALWDLLAAAEAVAHTGAPNAGVLVDTWHLARRGGDATTVEAVAVGQVLGLQVSDGPAVPSGDDLQQDCFSARSWPGHATGQLHPERVLASLLRRGWSGPVAVEVFGDAPDPLQRAARAAAALDAMLVAIPRGDHG